MENNKLFAEFPEVSTKEWEDVIIKDLKGADYEKKLVWKTLEGFDVKPYYRAEDLATLEYLNGNPAEAPFVRGYKKTTNAWDVRQDVRECDIATANAIALAGLKRGVTSLGLVAKNVKTAADMKALLNGIDLTAVKINFIKSEDYLETIKLFIDEVKAQGIDTAKVQGSINFDPYTCALRKGEFCGGGLEKRYEEILTIMQLVRENIPAFDVITVNGNVFNNAGAAIVQELAYTLSAANEYMFNLTQKGIAAHSVGYRMVLSFATGSNYFMEIAKLRAARLLWTKIVEQYNPQCATAYELHIHAENSFYNKTIYDPYVNMLRTTTETMSAAIAGADSISVYPFDVAYKKADEFSTRIATNQQILLKEESYLDKVVDPAAGSYYIESLTNALAEKAWEIFKELEEKGGFIASIKAGLVQDAIAETAAKRAKEVAMRKKTILGTNQYPNLTETKPVLENRECCGCAVTGNEIKPLPANRLAEP
ncbi:MAG: methylmalonyl-CoA mutase subunit beta, partial [Bacteroidales bacterium]|nr:methylmalonyl-CoA mutase subunit beta [Bacteroidales bacterium]